MMYKQNKGYNIEHYLCHFDDDAVFSPSIKVRGKVYCMSYLSIPDDTPTRIEDSVLLPNHVREYYTR